MDVLLGTVRVLQSGVQSNWWGLACPAHCGSPGWGALLASYLLGFISCLALAGFATLWIFRVHPCDPLPTPHQVVEPTGVGRLSRYLNESEPRPRSRRG